MLRAPVALVVFFTSVCAGCSGGGSGGGFLPDGGAGSGAAAGNAGAAGQAGAAGAGGTVSSCSGIEIATSGNLDLDAKSVHVSGAVRVNGAPLGDQTSHRGAIWFESQDTGDRVEIDLGVTGPASYAVRIPPGLYDVGYAGNSTSCEAATSKLALPCNDGPVLRDLKIEGDGVLDVDVPSVFVHGGVTVNGQVMPAASAERGALEFRIEGGSSFTSSGFGATGPGAYGLTLIAGTYDVSWDGSSVLCDPGMPASPVPCNDGPVLEDMELASDGVLDVNVSAVKVQGAVGINGQMMPAAASERGSLSFVRDSGDAFSTPSFGTAGGASYALTLLAGSYDVEWDGNSSACSAGVSPVPCNDGVVLSDIVLASDGVLDVNVPSVKVSGAVRINGAAMPAAPTNRGALEFRREDGSGVETNDFGPSGAASYQLTLVAGKYRVAWEGNSGSCEGGAPSPVPCNDGTVIADIALTSDGVLDVDVPTVRVQGNVLVNGAPLPSSSFDRGNLDFQREDGSTYSTPSFGPSGAASYQVTLLAGTYDVSWEGSSSACNDVTGQISPIPCNDGVVLTDIALASDGVLDVDVPAVTVQGVLRLAGQTLPAASSERGNVSFRLVGSGSIDSRSFQSDGPASYALTLLPGRYVISHDPGSELCAPGSALSVPCLEQVLLGCP